MRHECKITVLDTKVFPEYQEKYLADPKSGPCPFFKKEHASVQKSPYTNISSIAINATFSLFSQLNPLREKNTYL